MKVNNKFDFDDVALRKIGKAIGKRSGKAKRSEVRIWLNTLVSNTVQGMVMPVLRRKRTLEKMEAAAMARGLAIDETLCVNCGKAYLEHGCQGRSCPVSRTYNRPTKFKAVTV
jgi:hypothetical protein